jgi:PiT family inorganic phosphate transporter
MFGWLSGIFMGWSVGANDTSHCFGTAVSSRMVPWRLAAILMAFFVILGAVLQGAEGIETLRKLAPQTPQNAAVCAFAAALAVALMTLFKLPVSSTHAIVGAILGIGLMQGQVRTEGMQKIAVCWVGTPLGAMLAYIALHLLLSRWIRRRRPALFTLDPMIRGALIICGCYAAYALGANNVANAAAMLVDATGMEVRTGAALGGLAIAAGTLTFSRRVMHTVGNGIARIGSYEALLAVLSMALVTHLYAMLGVPVSTAHGIIGALLGLGFVQGMQVIHWRVLARVAIAWIATPVLAALLAIALYVFERLTYAA